MSNAQAFKDYFDKVEAYLKEDASSKNQKMPQTFRQGISEERGVLFGAAHFKYLVFGRGPGKFPPPDTMLAYVDKNPKILEDAKRIWKNITAKGLAYIIGRKIATEGTAIFKGDKPGIDFVGAIEKNKPDLLKSIARNQAVSIRTIIHNAARVLVVCLLFTSCSVKINLTKEQRKTYEGNKFARFKLSPKDVAWNTITFFVGYSMGKEVRKRIDSK